MTTYIRQEAVVKGWTLGTENVERVLEELAVTLPPHLTAHKSTGGRFGDGIQISNIDKEGNASHLFYANAGDTLTLEPGGYLFRWHRTLFEHTHVVQESDMPGVEINGNQL